MSLTVKLSIKDNQGKEAELEIKETDNLSKLVIIQNVFNLFGIEKDILDQTREFEKIGKAYSQFFEKVESLEVSAEVNEIVHKSDDIKNKMIEGFSNAEELKQVYRATEDVPEFVLTGIKIDSDGRKRYRCRYHCVICNNKATHYIFEGSVDVRCHSCRVTMPVKSAHPEGFPKQDTHGNFYRAGEYQDWKIH
ncbi:hypothetical protein BRE01_62930 [Brevibacillus reuszeri]|uniref:Uncharacterized protein n=1 Tax=Brevibacillus reuszeri TaxID=54915 RepID=A0A0K9YWH3_9BACL|nr:hypothetical protein [Brevibacillus reuszeri]KNB72972.1 hypothetical protein ADS79_14220 [Brevibacillus reuszeri]GED72591.1 hypothetical protein BRE01_62930 [Brevibacillus reuszeri]